MNLPTARYRLGLWSVALVFAAHMVPHAFASPEPTSELAAGGLMFMGPSTLKVDREDVVITAERLTVTYVIRNTTNQPQNTTFAFALPEIDMLALDGAAIDNPAFDPKSSNNYVGFTAVVDRQPPELFIQTTALALGVIDATPVLVGHNLPLYPLHPDLSDRLSALPPATKADLSARGLVRLVDGQLEPVWTLRANLSWRQAFAANQVRTVVMSYRPIVGTSAWTPDNADDMQRQFCVPDVVAKQLTEKHATGAPPLMKWVQFQAYAGAHARGPAAQSRLAIEVAPRAQAFTCREGLSGVNGTARESVQADQIADGEVRVLFVE